jgi:hypothetical protein
MNQTCIRIHSGRPHPLQNHFHIINVNYKIINYLETIMYGVLMYIARFFLICNLIGSLYLA